MRSSRMYGLNGTFDFYYVGYIICVFPTKLSVFYFYSQSTENVFETIEFVVKGNV